MTLTQLKHEQTKINECLIKQFREDNELIRTMAEHMAECATNIQGQGYTTFIYSRDIFLKKLDTMLLEYSNFLSVDTNVER